jgi:hypothetical protein
LAAFIAAILSSPLLVSAAQSPLNAPPPQVAAPAARPVSGLLQPALDTVRQTLVALRIDRWKKGSIRDEASGNIDSIQRDLRVNMPPLLADADAAPGAVSKLLPLSSHVDALYDVLLRVAEASRVVAPDDQAAQLQQALQGLSAARLTLDDRIKGSAEAMEKQVVDLHAAIQQQAAQRAAAAVPVALPCVATPPARKVVKKSKPAAKPAPKPSTTATSGTSTAIPPSSSH